MARVTHQAGQRIRLVHTDDPYTGLKPGDLGTVLYPDRAGALHVDWDTGSRLSLLADQGDRWEVVT